MMQSMSRLPDNDEMYRALAERDAAYEGIFVAAIRTTGIFCRPSCPARKPRPENVEYFRRAGDALAAGYRPCKRCEPMIPLGAAPDWLDPLLGEIDRDPLRRWTEQDLRDRQFDPNRVRRWFREHHGMTFLAYLRARRLGRAFTRLKEGQDVADSAYSAGFDSLSGFCEALRKSTGEAPRGSTRRRDLAVCRFSTPLGPMVAAGDAEAVVLLEFWDRRMLETQFKALERRIGAVFFPGENEPLRQIRGEAERFFRGELRAFATPLLLPGSEHQRRVWTALRSIPYGKTASYGEIARRLGKPSATRAVARAVGENRLAMVVPCHRVVGADGRLTGYGGGLWRKRWLLDHERQNR